MTEQVDQVSETAQKAFCIIDHGSNFHVRDNSVAL